DYNIAMDTTQFTRASIDTVVHTFFEALVLVVLVVFLFLQSIRATLIPIIAVPISIVGAAIGMTALGFSINMLTLFGMGLAVVISGIVALTLSPALAALLLKPGQHQKKGFFKWFENGFARMTEGYTRAVQLVIKRSMIALLLFAGMIAISVQLLRTIPSSFLP